MTTYSRTDFRLYFVRHYLKRFAGVLSPANQKLDLTNEANIDMVLAQFDGIWNREPGPGAAEIPRHIWMLWQQGWDQAPGIVRRCAETWQEKNPGWQVHLLDDKSLSEFAPSYDEIPKGKAWRSARSNLARVSLLMERGGVWADATLFCARPLDDWLPYYARTGLFMFEKPRPYRPISSWFIASAQNDPTIRAMREIYTQYWTYFEKAHHYFWMHYLFIYLMQRNPAVARAWEAVPKLTAQGVFIAERNRFDVNAPQQVFDLIDQALVPMHKLSHKWDFEGSLAGTPLGRLTGLDRLK